MRDARYKSIARHELVKMKPRYTFNGTFYFYRAKSYLDDSLNGRYMICFPQFFPENLPQLEF